MKQSIQYLNTDLDLAAPFDLAPLARAFSARGVFALHVSDEGNEIWRAGFEVDDPAEDRLLSPQATVAALLTAIETFDSESRRLWVACTQREFNIGYNCGNEPWAFNNELTSATIARMAALDLSLRITIYPLQARQGASMIPRGSDPD